MTAPSTIRITEESSVTKLKNPVVETSEYAYKATDLVKISEEGVKSAAKYIRNKLRTESYTPRTWRTHPLHICPSEPYNAADPSNKTALDWIFLISALNFSFWSEKEGSPERYGVEWNVGWGQRDRKVFTGYWSLVASLNRALVDDKIPIIDPCFYSSETLCPDSLIQHVFRPSPQSTETIPLLPQRIAIMREVGLILCNSFGGSYQGLIAEFQRRHDGQGTALDLVKMVTETFPSFRDEVHLNGRKIYFWKRPQILVAETWAAFYPPSHSAPHPLFPGKRGPAIQHLTMFADYRVPQILHHLRILEYPPMLIRLLHAGTPLAPGSKEEVSLRAASIVAVERVREEILRTICAEMERELNNAGEKVWQPSEDDVDAVSSVVIDFYLWDLAKKIESGEEKVESIQTAEIVPIHRTRSIWY